MKVKNDSEVTQSCPTLRDPMDCSLPDSSVHGISQASVLEWVAIPFSRGSSPPRTWTHVSCIGTQFLYYWATREAHISFSSVQSLSHVQLFATPWIAARQASMSITNCRSLLKPMSIESVMPSNRLILCRPLLLLPPIPPSIRVFANDSILSYEVAKALEFLLQHQSFQWTPRTDFF